MADGSTFGADRAIIQSARAYEAHGWVLTPINFGEKGPTRSRWQYRHDPIDEHWAGNIGLMHGPSGTCTIDLDQLDAARAWLFLEHGVDIDEYLAKDLQISSGKPGHGKLVYLLPEPLRQAKHRENGHDVIDFRCVSAKGTTLQDVLPPSVHPDGQQYQWVNGDWRDARTIPDELLMVWKSLLKPKVQRSSAPMAEGDPERALSALQAIDPDCDMATWCSVAYGFQAAGGRFEDFDDWSRGSDKYREGEPWNLWDKAPADADPQQLFGAARAAGWREWTVEQMFPAEIMPEERPQPEKIVSSTLESMFPRDRATRVGEIERCLIHTKGSKNREPEVRALVANVKAALTHGNGSIYPTLRYNLLSQAIEFFHPSDDSVCIEASDDALNTLHAHMTADFEAAFAKDHVFTQARAVARFAEYHPVQQYLSGLTWDGQPRVDDWTVRLLGADDELYHRRAGALWLFSAVERALRPGCKSDYIVILESDQGKRKSTALSKLVPNPKWYADLAFKQDLDDTVLEMQGKWIIEMGELKGMRRLSPEALKQFITRGVDRLRIRYDRLPQDLPRNCVMVGTTNRRDYLSDPTGNRRFLPIACGDLDIAGLEAERDQLWAEAFAMMQRHGGTAFDLVPDIEELAKPHQESRMADDPWEDTIRAYLEDARTVSHFRVATNELVEACVGNATIPPSAYDRVKGILSRLQHWEGPKNVKIDGNGKYKGKTLRGYAYLDGFGNPPIRLADHRAGSGTVAAGSGQNATDNPW